MNILLIPHDGDQPLTSEINRYDLVLSENEDGNFEVLKSRDSNRDDTTVTVWDPTGDRS